LDRDPSSALKNFDRDSKHGGEGVEDVGHERGIRYRFSGSDKFVLDFEKLREIAVDWLSGSGT
jgi:hypothetical protein